MTVMDSIAATLLALKRPITLINKKPMYREFNLICFLITKKTNKKTEKAKNSPIDSALGANPLHVLPLILDI